MDYKKKMSEGSTAKPKWSEEVINMLSERRKIYWFWLGLVIHLKSGNKYQRNLKIMVLKGLKLSVGKNG